MQKNRTATIAIDLESLERGPIGLGLLAWIPEVSARDLRHNLDLVDFVGYVVLPFEQVRGGESRFIWESKLYLVARAGRLEKCPADRWDEYCQKTNHQILMEGYSEIGCPADFGKMLSIGA